MKLIILFGIILIVLSGFAYAETLTYETGIYEAVAMDQWDLLYINNGDLLEEDGEIREPVKVEKFAVASDKAIKEVYLKDRAKSKEFDLNIPEVKYKNEETYSYEKRTCDTNYRDAYISTLSYDYADESSILIEIHPLEITNCLDGEFILYQELEIEIEYYEENKIKSVEHSGLYPGEKTTLTFELENRNSNSKIIVYDDWGNELGSKKPTSDKTQITVNVPEDTANLYFTAEYYENNEIVDRELIKQDLSWGKMDFRVLVSENPLVFPLAVQIDNKKEEEIEIDLIIISTNKDLEEMTKLKKIIKAPVGSTIHYLNFEITEEEKINDISIEATHNGIAEYAEHNSIVRFTHDEVKGGLPASPGQEIAEELFEKMKDPSTFESENPKIKKQTNMTLTIIVAIVAVILIIGLIIFAFKYMRKDKY